MVREGKRLRTTHLDVRVSASPLAHPRVGITIPKYQHTAVARNGVKRRLRELVRLYLLPTLRRHIAVDVAVRAKPEAYRATFDALREDVELVIRRVAE